jgi:single-stranded-DNA-specific exonuclease
MAKVWEFHPKSSDDLLEQLLSNRGFKKKSEIEAFFNPQIKDYEKDLELSGIDKAKDRILQAVKNQELIIIYGDYDADGVCGTAVLYYGLTALGAKVLPYIPHREKEGYGLSKFGLDQVKGKEAKLVVTVDNGIVAVEAAEYAASLGIDLIITDHHVPSETLPRALSIVHSTQMCGAAVGWCLVRQLVDAEKAEDLLDLVAIATVCDMLPLLGVNRVLVKSGLENLNQTSKVGLRALILEAKLKQGEITSYHVGHILGPRLNAIGRLEHAMDSLRLLCTKDPLKARDLAKILSEANDQKKRLISEALNEAKNLVLEQWGSDGPKDKILILSSRQWIPGIVGLMSGRLAEEYKMPVVVISEGELQSKGSARTVNGINIVETIRQCSDLLLDIGGHPQAAGFTLTTAKIIDFKTKLKRVSDSVELDQTEKLTIEALVDSKNLNKKLVTQLDQFEPTGVGNQKPVLASLNMRVEKIRTVGDGQHLKFTADKIDAIAFGLGNFINFLKEGQLVSLAYFLEIDNFGGSERLQLKVVDIQLA